MPFEKILMEYDGVPLTVSEARDGTYLLSAGSSDDQALFDYDTDNRTVSIMTRKTGRVYLSVSAKEPIQFSKLLDGAERYRQVVSIEMTIGSNEGVVVSPELMADKRGHFFRVPRFIDHAGTLPEIKVRRVSMDECSTKHGGPRRCAEPKKTKISIHTPKGVGGTHPHYADVGGYRFRVNSHPGGFFKDTVYLNESAMVSSKQRFESPVLLFSKRDWARLKDPHASGVHAGAFGGDFGVVRSDNGEEFVALWKIPFEINKIDGFVPVYRVPVPVGTYSVAPDEAFPVQGMVDLDEARRMMGLAEVATKYRVDIGPHEEAVHFLKDKHGRRVAMISSSFFFRNFYGPTEGEMKRVRELQAALYSELGIVSGLVNGNHHAVVFYITPEGLAKGISNQKTGFGAMLAEIIQRASIENKDAYSWAANYAGFFLSA